MIEIITQVRGVPPSTGCNHDQILTRSMMKTRGYILIIDDQKSDADEFERVLSSEGYQAEIAATAKAGLAHATRGNFDVVLTGLHLSGSDEQSKEGLHIISELQAAKPFLAVILMTAKPTTQTTIEA